jgi:hypothetical protein
VTGFCQQRRGSLALPPVRASFILLFQRHGMVLRQKARQRLPAFPRKLPHTARCQFFATGPQCWRVTRNLLGGARLVREDHAVYAEVETRPDRLLVAAGGASLGPVAGTGFEPVTFGFIRPAPRLFQPPRYSDAAGVCPGAGRRSPARVRSAPRRGAFPMKRRVGSVARPRPGRHT